MPPVIMSRREMVSAVETLPGRRRFGIWALNRGTLIVANSKAVAADSCSYEKQDPARYRVVYNACLTAPISKATLDQGVDRDKAVYLIANLRPQKGHSTALEASGLLRGQGSEIELVFVGGGPLEEELRRRADALGIAVRFTGPVPDPAQLLNPSTIFLQASETEGFPNALLEAMAMEAAIVATNVGGTIEAVGSAGILVPPRDANAMADGIATLVRDPELRVSLGQQAHNRALRFSLRRSVQEHVKVYQEALTLDSGL